MPPEWLVAGYMHPRNVAPYTRSYQYSISDALNRAARMLDEDADINGDSPHHVNIVCRSTGAAYTLTAGAD